MSRKDRERKRGEAEAAIRRFYFELSRLRRPFSFEPFVLGVARRIHDVNPIRQGMGCRTHFDQNMETSLCSGMSAIREGLAAPLGLSLLGRFGGLRVGLSPGRPPPAGAGRVR